MNNYKKVVCLNTLEIFNSVKEASNFKKISTASITNCCRFKVLSAGKDKSGNKLLWRYFEDYKNMDKSDLDKILNESLYSRKKVVCLNTNEIFNSVTEASLKYNINEINLYCCCSNKIKSSGKDEFGNKLIWKYLNDYNKLSKQDIYDILNKKNTINYNISNKSRTPRKVVCLTTGEIFNSINKASNKYNLHSPNIIKCCKSEIKSTGNSDEKKPLVWRYYEDYLNMDKSEVIKALNDSMHKKNIRKLKKED